jgi:pyruvate/2-oxoglutarate dehydrogenase complex dihydrolipoamide acyltransferase (E2) component
MTKFNVRVKPDHRWAKVQVGGREFTKAGEVLAAGHITKEMRDSGLLVIELAEETPAAGITEAAKKLAEENKVDLKKILGTGKGGVITVNDVREAL